MLHNFPKPSRSRSANLPKENSMTTTSLGWFDVLREAIKVLDSAGRSERFSVAKSSALRWAGALPRYGVSFGLKTIVDFVVRSIDTKANDLASRAIWFEAATKTFLGQTAELPVASASELAQHISDFGQINSELIIQCRKNIAELRSVNPQSRLAAAFERLQDAAIRLSEAALALGNVSLGISEASVAMADMYALNVRFDAALAEYDEEIEFDSDVADLADQALDRMRRSGSEVKH